MLTFEVDSAARQQLLPITGEVERVDTVYLARSPERKPNGRYEYRTASVVVVRWADGSTTRESPRNIVEVKGQMRLV